MKKLVLFVSVLFIFNLLFLPLWAQENSKVNIKSPSILKDQAYISYKKGNYQEALDYFLNMNPEDASDEVFLLISNCYDSLGKTDRAIDYLNRVIALDPKYSAAHYNIGLIRFKNNNIDGAIEDFSEAVKYDKKFLAAYYNLGYCYYLKNDYKKAAKNFEKALNLDPDKPDIYYNLYLAYEKLSNKKESQKYLDLYNKLQKAPQNQE